MKLKVRIKSNNNKTFLNRSCSYNMMKMNKMNLSNRLRERLLVYIIVVLEAK